MSARRAPVDHVIGIFSRATLSGALASTHRAGFGPHARVLDGARGDIGQQLARAGLELSSDSRPPADAVAILVTAPGRTAKVAELFSRLGAESVLLAGRPGDQGNESERPSGLMPDIRIEDGSGAALDA
jgi:hypothetical protein